MFPLPSQSECLLQCGSPEADSPKNRQELDFQTCLRLLGEAHEREIQLLKEKHLHACQSVEGENAKLRQRFACLLASQTESQRDRALPCAADGPRADDQSGRLAHFNAGRNTGTDTAERLGGFVTLSVADAEDVRVHFVSSEDCPSLQEVTDQFSEGSNDIIPLERCTSLEGSNDIIPLERCTSLEATPHPDAPPLSSALSLGSTLLYSLASSRSSHRSSPDASSDSTMFRLQAASSRLLIGEEALCIEERWLKLCNRVLIAEENKSARLHEVWHSTWSVKLGSMGPTDTGNRSYSGSFILSNTRTSFLDRFLPGRKTSRRAVSLFSASWSNASNVGPKSRAAVKKQLKCDRTNREKIKHSPLMMPPGCKRRVFWDFLCTLWCIHDFVMFPLQLFSQLNSERYTFVLTLSMAVFWTMDIFMSMSTGFYTREGSVEMRRRRIVISYAVKWLPLDLSVVLVDWALLVVPDSGVSKLSAVTRMVRMARLLRVIKLCPKVWDLIGQINSEHAYTLAQLLWYLFLIILINHYIACGLYGTWKGLGVEGSFAEGYLTSLHWAMAHSTLGSMDIYPKSAFERLWTCIILILSMIIFSTFLSSITNLIAHLRSLRQEKLRQEKMVRSFFAENNISRLLAAQIWNFIWHSDLVKKCHRTRESEVQLFRLLPTQILVEIKLEVFLPFLVNHPLFREVTQNDPGAIVKLCDCGIEQTLLQSSERLCWENSKEGNTVNRMLFVSMGSIVYEPFYKTTGSIMVQAYSWACEEVLWSSNPQLSGHFLGGAQGADLMCIVPDQFQAINKATTLHSLLCKYAVLFIDRFNSASMDDSYTNLLFNDPDMIAGIVDDAATELANSNPLADAKTIMQSFFCAPVSSGQREVGFM